MFKRDSKGLCKICRPLFNDLSFQEYDDGRSLRVLHKSSRSLKKSSKRGCPLCKQLVFLPGLRNDCTLVDLRKQHSSYHLTIHNERFGDELIEAEFLVQPVQKSASQRLFELGLSARAARNTGDARVGELAYGWLLNCVKNHTNCERNLQPRWHPTRLLIIENESVRLIDSNRSVQGEPYATISYCWGTKPFRVLTSQNIEGFRAGVPLESFPPTLRDVLLTIKRLHLRYVWIDSYCIIQGGDEAFEDKQYEIARMSEVYVNSIINIAASAADAPSEGCFVQRTGLTEPFQIPWRPEEGSAKGQYSVQVMDHASHFDTGLLYQRGWILQEIELAPRVLHFGRQQVYWECDAVYRASEAFPNGESSYKVGQPLFPNTRFSLLFRRMIQASKEDIWRFWSQKVLEYSRMGLSHPTEDKFPAIGALASRVAEILDDEYIIGHFRKRMAFDLLWKPSRDTIKQKARQWRAPSWSWASCDSPIDAALDASETDRKSADAGIVAIHIDLINPANSYGAVRSASIDLRGKVVELVLDEDGYAYAAVDGAPMHSKLDYDYHEAERQPCQDLALLQTVIEDEYTNMRSDGLVIHRVEPGVYERVGTYMTWKAEQRDQVCLFDKFEEQESRVVRLI